jgi:GNAT superfamily N-acetyltransferase
MPEIAIRQAGSRDAGAIFAVHKDSVQALCAAHYGPDHMRLWFEDRAPAIYDPYIAAGRLWVAEADGRVLGFVGTDPGEIALLFVGPASAGFGIGARLLAFGILKAREDFAGPVTVIATLNAEAFYARHGFRKVADDVFERGDPPLHYPVARMVLEAFFEPGENT